MMRFNKKSSLLIASLLLLLAIGFKSSTVYAKTINEVFVSNFPSLFKTAEEPFTTITLGSKEVHVNAGDLVNIPPLPNNEVLAGEYQGQGKLTYLVGRGTNSNFGIKIVIDGQSVAESNGNNLTILGTLGREGWRNTRSNNDVIEVNKEYAFKEKIQIYVYNHSNDPIQGEIHAELEVR